jgi:hypothetical protein
MTSDGEHETDAPLPLGIYKRAMADHLIVTQQRVEAGYNRHRALFAESLVAALIDGAVCKNPSGAWDVNMPHPRRKKPVRIQVKCSGGYLPRFPDRVAAAEWRLKPPKRGYDDEFVAVAPGHECDVFVFARQEGSDIKRGWHFYVLRCWDRSLAGNPITSSRLMQWGAVRCDPAALKATILKAMATHKPLT